MIADLRERGKTLQQIGDAIGRTPSTISRELSRNADPDGSYWCVRAHRRARERRKRGPIKFTAELVWLIGAFLKDHWSPEQISGYLREEAGYRISFVSIYAWIWKERAAGGSLWRNLRTSRKQRRKRYGSKPDYFPIKDRVSISQRPPEVDERTELGHWEVDLIEGAHHSGYLLVALERTTRFVRIGHLKRKHPDGVERRLIGLLTGFEVKTLTFDNGTEFSCHRRVAEELEAESYFCRPYCSWEKGAIENMNGLIRQYFPKGKCLVRVPWQTVKAVERKLNSRPRKVLSFLAPEWFKDQLRNTA